MANLVVTAVGAAIGGPLGGLVGAVGGALIGSGRGGSGASEGPRLSDLTVQGSSYGEPLTRAYGMTRLSGQVIWTNGLKESTTTTGGGKGGGPRRTTYSYTVSFAIALSARRIRNVRRIWANGRLLRNAHGAFLFPVGAMRVYSGVWNADADPLIRAVEGTGQTPHYRELAYIVFEDFSLQDFANRVPVLSFEIEADHNSITQGGIIADSFQASGLAAPLVDSGVYMKGFALARGTNLRHLCDSLQLLSPLVMREEGSTINIGISDDVIPIAAEDLGAHRADGSRQPPARFSTSRVQAASAREVSILFSDPDRDYQTGLQRAYCMSGTRRETIEVPAVINSGVAKRLAEQRVEAGRARLIRAQVHLPWRYAHLRVGDRVQAQGTDWRVESWDMEGLIVTLGLTRIGYALPTTPAASDAGRIPEQGTQPPGITQMAVIEPPLLPLESSLTSPRLLLAAGGTNGWSGADIWMSQDAGDSYTLAAHATPGAVFGVVDTVLHDGPTDRWDERSSIDITLVDRSMSLESHTKDNVLAGSNMAMIGNEVIQYRVAQELGDGRWRLSGLLRGRRGTEAAAPSHAAGESFVLLHNSLVFAEAPTSLIGYELHLKGVGRLEQLGAVAEYPIQVSGRNLRPLSPVHLRISRADNGDLSLTWTRRSRLGFEWMDGVDAPLGEDQELYRVRLSSDGGSYVTDVTTPGFSYERARQIADDVRGQVHISIRQISGIVGEGDALTGAILL